MKTRISEALKRAAFLLPFLMLLVLMSAPARADADAESRAAVTGQLDAMAAGDFETAYGFAAPGVQATFPSVEIFELMVRQGYPMVVAPKVRDFLGSEILSGMVVQRLRIVDQAGQAYVARYFLREIDGVWRIAAVNIEKADDLAV